MAIIGSSEVKKIKRRGLITLSAGQEYFKHKIHTLQWEER